jgi:acetyl-CoA C-acetyltransferase
MGDRDPVIIGGARTGIGRLLGSLAGFSAADLGGFAVKGALDRARVSAETVEYVIMGHVLQAGAGQITARQAAVKAGIPMSVPAITVNKVCLSGLDAIAQAADLIRLGEFDVIVAGGMESMTNAPHVLQNSRKGYKYGAVEMLDSMAVDGLTDAFDGLSMGESTERHNTRLGISRQEQDEFAARSQQRAVQSQENGFFEREITPVTTPDGIVVSKDDGPRPDTTAEKLAQLKPVFRPDGSVTAGNACPLNDGAAAVIVMSDTRANELGITPLARVVSSGVSALNPEIMGLGPIGASRQALARAGLTMDDIDLVEINEAFAAQVIPSAKHLGIPWEKLNVHGGGIALGHPFGMTGARIMTTLLNGLEDADACYGLETMCVGGGQGMAMIVERLT